MKNKSPLKKWAMRFHPLFAPEFMTYSQDAKLQLFAVIEAVKKIGPSAGRPHVDTLIGKRHANLKEMRFTANNGSEIWRVAFAFDTNSEGIILYGRMKQGKNQQSFYNDLVTKAESRFDSHLKGIPKAPSAVTKAVVARKPIKKLK